MDAHKIDTEEVVKRVNAMYKGLIRRDTYERDYFDFSKYKWVLGHKAYASLEAAVPMKMAIHEAPKLTKTETIELWENITEKL